MADRITAKTLDNLARILCINLGRPESPYGKDGAQIGNLHITEAGYGYGIDRVNTTSGAVSRLESGMTAKECYAWLQGALAVCREAGHDGPIAERWNGTFLRSSGKHSVAVKYVGPTDHKPARWQAKDYDGNGTVYGAFTDGPIQAAIKWAERVGITKKTPSNIIQLSPDFYAVEF